VYNHGYEKAVFVFLSCAQFGNS